MLNGMEPLRGRRGDLARQRGADIVRRTGREVRLARVQLGMSQQSVATRARISQSTLSRIELGTYSTDVATLARISAAVGTRLSVQLYPTERVRLRDSGQLGIAQALTSLAHPDWRPSLELPVAPPPDMRAADLVFTSPLEVLHLEIERNLVDLQAQLRAGLLKREALAQRYQEPVRFVLVLPDTTRLRRLVDSQSALISTALPRNSRQTAAALRGGEALGADGLLWVRPGRLPSAADSALP